MSTRGSQRTYALHLHSTGSGLIFHAIRELLDHRNLLYMSTWREIKVKYKQSDMGMLWAVLMPLVIECAALLVRYAFAMVLGTPLALSDLTSVTVTRCRGLSSCQRFASHEQPRSKYEPRNEDLLATGGLRYGDCSDFKTKILLLDFLED
jgi:hypothetical protein